MAIDLNPLGPLVERVQSSTFWARLFTGALGIWLVWIGIVLLLASNDKVQGAVTSIATKGVVS